MLKEFVYLNKRQEKKKLDLLVLGSLIVFLDYVDSFIQTGLCIISSF